MYVVIFVCSALAKICLGKNPMAVKGKYAQELVRDLGQAYSKAYDETRV